jgi:hypothetical protein
MDCNDDCNGRLDCKKQKITKVPLEKVEVSHTKDGKGSGLFAMEDIDRDEYVIEYVRKLNTKEGRTITW